MYADDIDLRSTLTDFNFAPDDAAYVLLMGGTLSETHEADLSRSRVVHRSIDPSIEDPPHPQVLKQDEEGEAAARQEEEDEDRTIKHARVANRADGLLDDEELRALCSQDRSVSSAYHDGQKTHRGTGVPGKPSFGELKGFPLTQQGFFEPGYTSYTHYWKTVLGRSDL